MKGKNKEVDPISLLILNHNKFMGYTKNEEDKLITVPEEATVVRRIFDLYLQGLGVFHTHYGEKF